jgi:hypothetical protein
MENKDFAIFILTHGRADNVVTYNTLISSGYTGKIYIIIDNEDKTYQKYYDNFGKENVIMFDKLEVSKTFDEADNFNDRRAIVYARNACFDIAKKLGIKYFMQLDDDYSVFLFRINQYGTIPKGHFKIKTMLDSVINSLLKFYISSNADSIAMAQGGDFIGGEVNSFYNYQLRRKCMNTFICSTDRPFQFVGRINEDVNTYTRIASTGKLFLTTPLVSILQKETQSNDGGMTDIYLDNGTYIKSFYSVIFSPSSVRIGLMGNKNMRMHHKIKWNNAVPKIIEEKYKK